MQTAICKRQKCNLYGMRCTYVSALSLSLSLPFPLPTPFRISADQAAAAAAHIRGIFHMTAKGAFLSAFFSLFLAHFNCNSNISDNYSTNTTGISKERDRQRGSGREIERVGKCKRRMRKNICAARN